MNVTIKFCRMCGGETQAQQVADEIEKHMGIKSVLEDVGRGRFEIFVNLTPTGSYDKTTLEAMACESLVLVSNRSYERKIDTRFIFLENNADDLARKIESLFSLSSQAKTDSGSQLRDYVLRNHSLSKLMDKLVQELKSL